MDPLRVALSVIWTIVAVTARRLLRGPRLAGWTLGFELSVAVTRRLVDESARFPPEVLRRRYVGARISRALRSRIARASTRLGGCATETFTPAGWTESDPTILYLPGGGYVVGSPATHADLIAHLAVDSSARALAIEYRKAPEHPFPAAVDDCEAAYRALLDSGVPPDQVILAGDSAGGGLALAVGLRAREAGLPLPAALLLLSPWTSLECRGESMTRNAPFDYVTATVLKRAAEAYAPGANAGHPHASVINADLQGLPSTFILTGGAEVLLSDNQALAARAAEAGVRVSHDVEENMVHVFPAFYRVQPRPGRRAMERMGDFVRRRGRDAAQSPDPPSLPGATTAVGRSSWLDASDFEFRHRMSIIGSIFAISFACSWLDPHNAGATLGAWLSALGVAESGAARHVAFSLAAVLVAAGAGLRTWGTAYLNVQTMMDERLRTDRLVVAGPYRRLRNPLYLGNLLVCAGVGLLASRTGYVALVSGMVVFSCRLILREEQHLLRRHGDAFLQFLEVPRLWPAWRARPGEPAARPAWGPALAGESLMWSCAVAMAIYAATFSMAAFVVALSAGAIVAGLRFRATRQPVT